MAAMVGSSMAAGRHDTRVVTKSLHLIHKHKAGGSGERNTLSGKLGTAWAFERSNPISDDIPSSTMTPPSPSKQVHPLGIKDSNI